MPLPLVRRLWFLWVALAWAPFALLLAYSSQVYYEISMTEALIRASLVVGWAAILGAGVWWVTGRITWPTRVRPSFYLAQVGLATVYSVLWLLGLYFTRAMMYHDSLLRLLRDSPSIVWEFSTGCIMYGLVAGLSYTIRLQELVHARERSANRLAALAARARLKALRGQLRPHFLFNALHSVRALITIDPKTAELAVEQLGEVLRYVLAGYDKRDVVRLGDEWAFTRTYLDIERLRFEERLSVTSEFADGVEACLLPTFALQTLVENAVRHAVAPRPEGGTINIRCRQEAETLVVSVRSSGAESLSEKRGRGRGLPLLKRRMRELYGTHAAVAVSTDATGGVTAELRVPQRNGQP